jgi:hypothetical protein
VRDAHGRGAHAEVAAFHQQRTESIEHESSVSKARHGISLHRLEPEMLNLQPRFSGQFDWP